MDRGGREFGAALVAHGVVSSGADALSASHGHKWRMVLAMLGFLSKEGPHAFSLTPHGQRLLAASSPQSIEECMLRSLLVFELHPQGATEPIRPLMHVLQVLEALSDAAIQPMITRAEMKTFVITSGASTNVGDLISDIAEYRAERERRKAARALRGYDAEVLANRGLRLAAQSYSDYADASLRYLKATGLFDNSPGQGIMVADEKAALVGLLLKHSGSTGVSREPLQEIRATGAPLPTDDLTNAQVVFDSMAAQAEIRGVDCLHLRPTASSHVADWTQARHEVDALMQRAREADFAREQQQAVPDIVKFMIALEGGDPSGSVIPAGEGSAYLEWTLWRALLAIGGVVNPSHEVRGFKVDRELKPLGYAPGGRPDLVAEFEDFVLVVEVTLAENSRQEAMEGEPVRRHVSDAVREYAATGKPVYGLFIAKKVDTNSVETFRVGVWYLKDDARQVLSIVPLTLTQFRSLFAPTGLRAELTPQRLQQLLDLCLSERQCDGAPAWRSHIRAVVETQT